MSYNYRKLSGRIVEVFGTQAKFADAMQKSERTISLKMNNKIPWNQQEILSRQQNRCFQPSLFFLLRKSRKCDFVKLKVLYERITDFQPP